MSHYEQTVEEIIESLGGDIQYLFVGSGTGGSLTGMGRKLEEKVPNCKVWLAAFQSFNCFQLIAVDPAGSILAEGGKTNDEEDHCFEVEGVGYDFVPGILDRRVVEQWVKANDKVSLISIKMVIILTLGNVYNSQRTDPK